MAEQETLLAELERIREKAAGLVRARLAAISEQMREAAARIESDMEIAIPPDPETFLPLDRVREIVAAMAPPPPPPTVDLELLRALDAGRAQSDVLQEMLARLAPWCDRRAIVVLRDGGAIGWAGAGFDDDEAVRGWQAPLDSSAALSRVAQGASVLTAAGEDDPLAGWFPGAERVLAVPMSLRGKVVGALVASDDGGRLEAEPIQIVAFVTGLLLETLAVRSVTPSPALIEAVPSFEAAVAQPVEEAAAEEEVPAIEEAPAVEEPVEAEPAAEAVPGPEVGGAELEEAVEAEEAVTVEEAPPIVEEVEPGVETAGEDIEAESVAAAAAPDEAPVVAVPPVRSAEDERKHEEAKRFARLLVSEIRLYNEQAVVDGKQNRDIYQRLREDIDRSREMYEQRVSPQVRSDSNYFFEELVRILGDGDPDVLGL